MQTSPCCLTIAGSDCGGNAGVQADLRAFHSYALHGCSVFTALTAQNPFGVSGIHNVPPTFVEAQLDAVLGVYNIRALKTGMLSSADIIEAVAGRLADYSAIAKVIDPVMVATSGAPLIANDAIAVLANELLPQATIITPNLPEAECLCGQPVDPERQRDGDVEHARDLAKNLFDRFGCAVLVKGGHGHGASAVDVFYDGHDFAEFSRPWIEHPVSTHGTGCTLAAALTAELALGHGLRAAVEGAKRHVHRAIASSYWVGKDCGVLGFVQ